MGALIDEDLSKIGFDKTFISVDMRFVWPSCAISAPLREDGSAVNYGTPMTQHWRASRQCHPFVPR